MTRRRRILLSAGIVAASIVATIGVLAMLPPRPGVTKANFDRIEKGMTLAATNEVFGKQATFVDGWERDRPGKIWIWHADDGAFAVGIFFDDEVNRIEWANSTETLPDKIRRWLHLPK